MDIKDGGPAFPLTKDAIAYETRDFQMQGMSLRDFFAAQALQGIWARAGAWRWYEFFRSKKTIDYPSAEHMAEKAYASADAMLKAREGK